MAIACNSCEQPLNNMVKDNAIAIENKKYKDMDVYILEYKSIKVSEIKNYELWARNIHIKYAKYTKFLCMSSNEIQLPNFESALNEGELKNDFHLNVSPKKITIKYKDYWRYCSNVLKINYTDPQEKTIVFKQSITNLDDDIKSFSNTHFTTLTHFSKDASFWGSTHLDVYYPAGNPLAEADFQAFIVTLKHRLGDDCCQVKDVYWSF